MECREVQQGELSYGAEIPEETVSIHTILGHCLQDIIKKALSNFAQQSHNIKGEQALLAARWSEDAPYTEEEIRSTWEASYSARDEAQEHTKNAWEALGNGELGTVVRESMDGWSSLRESEQLQREAVQMENSNIDHYNK